VFEVLVKAGAALILKKKLAFLQEGKIACKWNKKGM